MKRAVVLLLAALLGAACAKRTAPPAPTAAAPAASTTAAAPAASSEAASAAAAPAASASAAAPAPPEPSYELRMGKQVFVHYCQTCHGEAGAGDGFNAFNLDPHPRDLSDPAFQDKKSDADLREAVRRGGAGVGLSPLMPPWGRTLSAREIEQVLLFVRSLKRTAAPATP